eukprot:Colp12_sorted_trinity150504_noHs@14157
MRLNRLENQGGRALLEGLKHNSTLVALNLSSNCLGQPTALVLADVLRSNTTLTTLDVTCNKFEPAGGKALLEGMATNSSLASMDLRLTDVGQENELGIMEILKANAHAKARTAV